MSSRFVSALVVLLSLGDLSGTARAAASAALPRVETIRRGTAVSVALARLRERGLSVIFSDRVVTADLRVEDDLVIHAPREAAERLLAPHGLQLRSLRPGSFVVVRAPVPRPETSPATMDETEPLTEVEIYASRYSVEAAGVSTVQMQREDIETLAGLDEDALRVAQIMPGTASTPLSARTHVRGGSDDEMLVRFDGVPRLAPYHFRDYGAVLGSIDPVTVEGLDFYSGIFPARHGDRLSAVMDLHPREAKGEDHHEIGISLLALHALSVGEREVAGAPMRWLVAGRSSTAGWLARAADIDDVEIEFSDLLLRGERVVGDWTLVAGLSTLQDELDYQDLQQAFDREETSAGYRDNTLWLKARQGDAGDRHLEASFAAFDSRTDRRGELSQNEIVSGRLSEDRHTRGHHLEVAWRQPGAWSLGLESLDLRTRYDHAITAVYDPDLAAMFDRPTTLDRQTRLAATTRTWAAHASKLFVLSPSWRMDLGVRVDHRDRPRTTTGASPRLAMEYEFGDGRFLRASAGRTTQGQRADELQVADGEPVFHAVQTADQVVLSYERLLADRGAWRVEAYHKRIADPAPRYENILDPVSIVPEMEIDRERVAPDAAVAYGVEFSGRYAFDDRWSGFLNYAWSEVEDEFGGLEVPRAWNQQHSLVAGLLWRAGPWRLSGQGTWHTGWRRTEFVEDASGTSTPMVADSSRARWPAQWSLDLRAAWRRPLSLGALEVALDINNATDRSNPCCTELSRVDGVLQTRTRSWLPRYLNLGVVWSLP
jgi:hypothetical protein